MRIKILLVEHQKIVRQGLLALLQGEPDMEIVGEAETGGEVLLRVAELSPHVVILDTPLPDAVCQEVITNVLTGRPDLKVIVITSQPARTDVSQMLAWGVQGVLGKDCSFEELSQAVRLVASGQTYLAPGFSPLLPASPQEYPTKPPANSVLTPREREVLRFLAEGKTTSQIAALLFISIKTVETHRQKIMHKLNLHSVAELTKYAIKTGLTTLND